MNIYICIYIYIIIYAIVNKCFYDITAFELMLIVCIHKRKTYICIYIYIYLHMYIYYYHICHA